MACRLLEDDPGRHGHVHRGARRERCIVLLARRQRVGVGSRGQSFWTTATGDDSRQSNRHNHRQQ